MPLLARQPRARSKPDSKSGAAQVPSGEQRLLLSDISWDAYVRISDSLPDRHIRITFDRGEMEIMTTSARHENRKTVMGRLIETMTEEMEIDIASFGSMTCRRKILDRGLEGDEAYWIQNELVVRGRDDLNLDIDPPPDLAVEVEISRSALNRMGIYAALKVPEVWRWNGAKLRIFILDANGEYQESPTSRAFPFLPIETFTAFLLRTDKSETQLVRTFRAWVRKNKRKWLR